MPELPEVEVIRRQLEKYILNKPIKFIETLLPKMWRNTSAKTAEELLLGQCFVKLERRGKYLLFSMDSGLLMVIHLKMTGRLVYREKYHIMSHDRIGFQFMDDSALVFGDIRTFGGIYIFESKDSIDLKGLVSMGPEPLSSKFTSKYLYDILQKSSLKIKTFLLDQNKIAGIGNIYADEALFKAGILPNRRARKTSPAEAAKLHRAIRAVLRQGLAYGGTSFRDYQNGEGTKGYNQDFLNVYGRGGEPCLKCGYELKTQIINGRRSVYCTRCQK